MGARLVLPLTKWHAEKYCDPTHGSQADTEAVKLWLGAAVHGQWGPQDASFLAWLQTASLPALRRRHRQAGGSSWLGACTDSLSNAEAFKGVLQDARVSPLCHFTTGPAVRDVGTHSLWASVATAGMRPS